MFSASFEALILKFENQRGLGDYSLITLVGSLYKIVVNILSNRLKKVIGKLILNSQATFIPGRQIQDGIVALNEIVDFAKQRKDV